MIKTFNFERDDFKLEMNEKPTDFVMSEQTIIDETISLTSREILEVSNSIPLLLKKIPTVFNTTDLFCKVEVEIIRRFPYNKFSSGVNTIIDTCVISVTTLEGILLYHK